jgi:hypothetical protein
VLVLVLVLAIALEIALAIDLALVIVFALAPAIPIQLALVIALAIRRRNRVPALPRLSVRSDHSKTRHENRIGHAGGGEDECDAERDCENEGTRGGVPPPPG